MFWKRYATSLPKIRYLSDVFKTMILLLIKYKLTYSENPSTVSVTFSIVHILCDRSFWSSADPYNAMPKVSHLFRFHSYSMYKFFFLIFSTCLCNDTNRRSFGIRFVCIFVETVSNKQAKFFFRSDAQNNDIFGNKHWTIY